MMQNMIFDVNTSDYNVTDIVARTESNATKLSDSLVDDWELYNKLSEDFLAPVLGVDLEGNFDRYQFRDKKHFVYHNFVMDIRPYAFERLSDEQKKTIGAAKVNKIIAYLIKFNEARNSYSTPIKEGDFETQIHKRFITAGRFSVDLEIFMKGSYSSYLKYRIGIELSDKDISFIGKDILKQEGSENILQSMLNEWWESDAIDPAYDISHKLPTKSKTNGPVKLTDGSIFYIPKNLKSSDKRKEFFELTIKNKSTPSNFLVYIDTESNVLVQTNSSKNLKHIPLTGITSLSNEDLKSLLDRTLDAVISDRYTPSSLFNHLDLSYKFDAELDSYFTSNGNTNISELDSKVLVRSLIAVKKVYEGHKENVLPSTYLTCVGIIQAVLENIGKYKSISKDVTKRREAFDNATGDDIIAIPSLRKDLLYFPHQAEAISKSIASKETAIWDVSTGGGKTLLMIADALNLIGNKKAGKNPLIVVPNSLVGQWIGQVAFFTENQVNAVALTTETLNNWGEEGLEEIIANAPLNTIFITTYSFLTRGSEEYDWGGYSFPQVEWILTKLNPVSVSLDEAHLIKNPDSMRAQACLAMKGVPYRRIGTGTLISNNPSDLVGQIAFLDPRVVGDIKEFGARYGKYLDGRGNVIEWKDDAAEMIRSDLKNNSFYMMYREKDWAYMLPDIEYKTHLVKMTPNQQRVYKVMVEEMMSEILNDPILAKQWYEFIDDGGEDDSSISVVLLGKMAKLEQFLTGPDRSAFVGKALSDKDKISPKVSIIDNLIEKSLKANSKCIVAVHYKHSARHLLENSKYRDVGVYYDAGHKSNIGQFMTNNNVKLVFAVVQSITEGLNLQVANRIILADMDWTPGKTKQLIARIFRPHVGKDKDGNIVNLNEGKTVNIDYVLAENSADTLKYCLQTYKKLLNSSIMEESPIDIPSRPKMDEAALSATFEDLGGPNYVKQDSLYQEWIAEDIKLMKEKGNSIPIAAPYTKPIRGRIIDTPWVVGMPLPKDVEGTNLVEYLEDNDLDVNDARKSKEQLVSKIVRTQFGEGKIVGVYKNSVRVKDADGETYSSNINTTILLDKATLTIKEKIEETKTTDSTKIVKDSQVEIDLYTYNDILTLIADLDDPDSEDLKQFGFIYQGNYKYIKIKNKKFGYRTLSRIQSKYKIPKVNTDNMKSIFDYMTKGVYEYEVDEDVKLFLKLKHRKATKGQLKLYPLVENEEVFLVYDVRTNPGASLSGFKTSEGYWYKFCKNKNMVKSTLSKINKKFIISNKEELIEEAQDTYRIRLAIK